MIRRRRSLPPHLLDRRRGFEALVPDLERATAALTQAVPGTRLPGRPLADALSEFEEGLRGVRSGMDAWRAPEVEEAWRRADRGLDRALQLAERVRLTAEEPRGFEGLVGLVGGLLEPLEPFAEAADRFRELRAGRGRPSR